MGNGLFINGQILKPIESKVPYGAPSCEDVQNNVSLVNSDYDFSALCSTLYSGQSITVTQPFQYTDWINFHSKWGNVTLVCTLEGASYNPLGSGSATALGLDYSIAPFVPFTYGTDITAVNFYYSGILSLKVVDTQVHISYISQQLSLNPTVSNYAGFNIIMTQTSFFPSESCRVIPIAMEDVGVPIATPDIYGLMKNDGVSLKFNEGGQLYVDFSGITIPIATPTVAGAIKYDNVTVKMNSLEQIYVPGVQPATSSSLGTIMYNPNYFNIDINNWFTPLVATSMMNGIGRGDGSTVLTNNGLFSVPLGSSTQKGLLQVGTSLTVSNSIVDVPTGSASQHGILQVGNNLTVNSGVVDVPISSTSTFGLSKSGTGLQNSSGTYNLLPATTSSLGGVKPDGTTTTIDPDGTIHAVGSSQVSLLASSSAINITTAITDFIAMAFPISTTASANGANYGRFISNIYSVSGAATSVYSSIEFDINGIILANGTSGFSIKPIVPLFLDKNRNESIISIVESINIRLYTYVFETITYGLIVFDQTSVVGRVYQATYDGQLDTPANVKNKIGTSVSALTTAVNITPSNYFFELVGTFRQNSVTEYYSTPTNRSTRSWVDANGTNVMIMPSSVASEFTGTKAEYVNGNFVAVSHDDVMYFSTTGAVNSWSSYTLNLSPYPDNGRISDICYFSGNYYICCVSGEIYKSSTMTTTSTWTFVTDLNDTIYYIKALSTNQIVCGGETTSFYTSTDGNTFTKVNISNPQVTMTNNAYFVSNGRLNIGGTSMATNSYVYVGSDSLDRVLILYNNSNSVTGAWAMGKDSGSGNPLGVCNDIVWDGTNWCAVGARNGLPYLIICNQTLTTYQTVTMTRFTPSNSPLMEIDIVGGYYWITDANGGCWRCPVGSFGTVGSWVAQTYSTTTETAPFLTSTGVTNGTIMVQFGSVQGQSFFALNTSGSITTFNIYALGVDQVRPYLPYIKDRNNSLAVVGDTLPFVQEVNANAPTSTTSYGYTTNNISPVNSGSSSFSVMVKVPWASGNAVLANNAQVTIAVPLQSSQGQYYSQSTITVYLPPGMLSSTTTTLQVLLFVSVLSGNPVALPLRTAITVTSPNTSKVFLSATVSFQQNYVIVGTPWIAYN